MLMPQLQVPAILQFDRTFGLVRGLENNILVGDVHKQKRANALLFSYAMPMVLQCRCRNFNSLLRSLRFDGAIAQAGPAHKANHVTGIEKDLAL